MKSIKSQRVGISAHRTSKNSPFPVTRTCSPIAHRRPNGSSASATSCRKKTRLGKQQRFSSAPRRPLFGRRRRRSPWQGGDAGVNRPCPPAKKSSSAACLRTFPYYTGFLPACGPLQLQRSTDSVTDALLLAAFGSGVLLVTDAVFWNGAFAQALSIPASCSETASPGAR